MGHEIKWPKRVTLLKEYKDHDKPTLIHDTNTIRLSCIRIVLSVASILGMRLFCHDVTQAYLQSMENSPEESEFIRKSQKWRAFGLSADKLFEIHILLYGLWDA